MQLSTVFAVLAASVIAVAAGEYPPPWPKPSSSYYKRDLTNGERMARNLPLRPPTRYWGATPTYDEASQTPESCHIGHLECCESLATTSDSHAAEAIQELGAVVGPGIPIGLNCSPFKMQSGCSLQPVCCEVILDNSAGIGCSAMNY